jgi:hypothetical protein
MTLLRILSILLYFMICGVLCKPEATGELTKIASHMRNLDFDRQKMANDLSVFTAAAHPLGSPRQKEIADHLLSRIRQAPGVEAVAVSFEAATPNPEALKKPSAPIALTQMKTGINVFARTARLHATAPSCAIVLASHYDTKNVSGITYTGANDSGSSSIALLQFVEHSSEIVKKVSPRCEIIAAWFDGEEAVLDDWHAGEREHPAHVVDHTYGSRHLAASLTPCRTGSPKLCLPPELGKTELKAVIVMDMIGSPNLQITLDQNSTPRLIELMQETDRILFEDRSILSSRSTPIEDDHIPFAERGIAALDIIDFNNIETWHRDGDFADRVSLDSIIKSMRLSFTLAAALAQNPDLIP